MNTLKSLLAITTLSTLFLISACDGEDPKPALDAITFENLAADPATGFNPTTGQPIGTTGKYKFFSFSTGQTVLNSDSATNNWDIGFRGTTILVNSGTSGPGTASAQVVEGIFDEYITAPEEGYSVDGTTKAIPTGSGNGWYTTTSTANGTVVSPIAGKIIIVKTTSGKYAKMEILSYYKDAPASPNPTTDMARYYTFRYVYQPDGSRNLK
jgi:hypothetical protein